MLFAFVALLVVLYLFKQLRQQKQQSQSWWQAQQAEVQAQEPFVIDEPDAVVQQAPFLRLHMHLSM